MSDAAAVKEAIAKVEKGIDNLTEQLNATRSAMEQLSQDLSQQMEKTIKEANKAAQEIHRDITTFREQRQLVETQLIAEVDRAKELSNLKDIEEAIRIVIEVVDELTNRINLDEVLEAVKVFETSTKGGK
jgi:predicted ribonuclease toxin of YeeF-YezG toxin-antitoxin module